MRIEQTFQVPFPPDRVWRCFQDTEGIVACLPGASLAAAPDNGKLKLAMTVKLGPIVAAFAGDGDIGLDDTTRRGRVAGGGSDRKSGSRVKGEAAFSLHEEPSRATRVDIHVDFTITGSLAQFSRDGIVRELAARMTEAFAGNLKRKLEAENGAVHAAQPSEVQADAGHAASARAETPAPVMPLDLGGLFWPMLLARLRRWLRFGSAK